MSKGHYNTYSTISEIVDGVCLDLGEGSHRKEQYMHWAIKHINRWNMDMAREIKTVKLDLTAWKSIMMPDDCIDWIKVGIQDGNVIKTFVHTKDIALAWDKVDNVKVYNDDPVDPLGSINNAETNSALVWPFYNYTQHGEDAGKLFGVGMKDNGFGYFTEVRNQGSYEIQFRTKIDAGTKIYLEYLATGVNSTAETLVHPYAVELIALGVHHERLKHDKNAPRIVVQEALQEYEKEFYRVQDRQWDYNVEEILEWIRNGNQMSPKV